ncbi:MAG: translesion error-prone DNA polymerase V autoproteolytic subunit [Deltaproteobacteria bacterium]|jgi:DNA polymerase V|nr:translesion error-prone DNA polymerase V autoproteolytic subunit [Deltaproteobacteria bacterium]
MVGKNGGGAGGVGLTVLTPEPVAAGREGGSPLFLEKISAGFPSPAEGYVQDFLDLQRLVVKNPAATFFLRVAGDSMTEADIHDGDLLVVDRSKPAVSGKIVIASLDGELTVKRLKAKNKRLFLVPENPGYPETDITEREDTVVWGVVTYVVHKV